MVIDILFLCWAVVLWLMICEVRQMNTYSAQNAQIIRRINQTKRIIAANLIKRGCILKNAHFVYPKCGFRFLPRFLFFEKQNIFILGNKICKPNVGVFDFHIDICFNSQQKSINFSNFVKAKGNMVCETAFQEYSVQTTIASNLNITFRVKKQKAQQEKPSKAQNLQQDKQQSAQKLKPNLMIKLTFSSQNAILKHANSCVQVGKTSIKYTSAQCFLREATPHHLSLVFKCNSMHKTHLNLQLSHNNARQKLQAPLHLFSIKFFAQKRQFLTALATKINNKSLSNFAQFDKVKKVCKQINISYEKSVFFSLFSSSDYANYKKTLHHLALYKLFKITPVFLYKNVHMREEKVHFYNYFGAPLGVVNFLLQNGNLCGQTLKKIQSKKANSSDKFFDLKTLNSYHFFDVDKCPNFENFSNFRKIDNALKLENTNEKVYYNFSCPFKIEAGKIAFRDACVCAIKSEKHLKKSYYECLVDKAQNDAQKQLFINFWQDEKTLKMNIENAIELCQPVALIYLQDKQNFITAFENFYSKYTDLTSKFIMFYYLCKYAVQTNNAKQYVTRYGAEILQNIRKCFALSRKCRDCEQKILLYLHSKNLQNLQIFCDDYIELNEITTTLSKDCDFAPHLNATSFDDLIAKFPPTLFNYEYVLDFLLEIKSGCFRFKSDVCAYENVFKLNYNGAHASVLLIGKKLSTIHGNLQVNENLFIPLNLQGISRELKIY